MDITQVKHLTAPAISAQYAPVLWEPLTGSGERICAIVIIVPEVTSAVLLTPAAHVVITHRRLRAMLGSERAESVLGILKQSAEFMTRRLHAGADISGSSPPFKNFTVGPVRTVRGFTAEQVLDAAVRMVSAFGSAEDLIEEVGDLANHSTASTREFLARVQTSFAPADDERRKRFLRPVDTRGGRVTIDYVHDQHLVQFASAPTTLRQAQNMRREAEAKILETLTVQKAVMEGQAKPALIINTAPLHIGRLTDSALIIAQETMAHFNSLAVLYDIVTTEAASPEEAVLALVALS